MFNYKQEKDKSVIRVVTTSWYDGNALHTKRSLRLLKRKSFGRDVLEEECEAIGADDAALNIINLYDVQDGIYELVAINITKDIETGYVDYWELKLIPYTEQECD